MLTYTNNSLTRILTIGVQVRSSIIIQGIQMDTYDWSEIRRLDPDLIYLGVGDETSVPVDFRPIIRYAEENEDISKDIALLLQPSDSLVSVFTSTYNTGKGVLSTYVSLKSQSYINWEWVVVDDSDDDGWTYNLLKSIASEDRRVKVYRFFENTHYNIGEAKYRASMLCNGKISVELDHDDILTPDALKILLKSTIENPECGFYFSDWVEYDFKSNKSRIYSGGRFGFGYGETYGAEIMGRKVHVCQACSINPTTIRHIVSVPNHLRAWDTATLKMLGYNRRIRVADDYELFLRTFLCTKMLHINRPLYVQAISPESATNESRDDIQKKVGLIHDAYSDLITKRLELLGVEDPFKNLTHDEFLNAEKPYFSINLAKRIK